MEKINNDQLQIDSMIFIIRGMKVMLDSDLAKLYEVETKRLKEQVRRNIERFPGDFMFELTREEVESLGLNSKSYGGQRYLPMAFTENGIAMLSSVLNSSNAIQINISIMRTFTKLRSFLAMESSLNLRMEKLESDSTALFKIIFEKIDSLESQLSPLLPPARKKIGIKPNDSK